MADQEKDIGAIKIWGRKYDLEKMIETAEHAVGSIIEHFGTGGEVTVGSYLRHGQRYAWPRPGQAFVRMAWTRLATIFEAADEALIYSAGRITVISYLLGSAKVFLNGTLGILTTQDGRYIDGAFDPVPAIAVFGREPVPGRIELLNRNTAEAVGRLFSIRHESLELQFGCQEAVPGSGRFTAVLFFPYRTYGSGEGLIGARCVVPGGQIIWHRDAC